MSLFVFIGLAWLLTAPAVAVLLGKVFAAAERRACEDSLFASLEADLEGDLRPAHGRY
ncbi:hypothetical protein [Blastococcus sp. SYSU D00695]